MLKPKSRIETIEYLDDEELTENDLIYIQMILPIKKITADIEIKFKKKIELLSKNVKIEEALKEDLARIMNLYNRTWLTSKTPFRRITLESVNRIFENPNVNLYLAKLYGIDAGFMILSIDEEDEKIGIIDGLGVLPRFQRKGVGTVLGMTAWEYFKQKKIEELKCEVYVENKRSYEFIKSLGFEEEIYQNSELANLADL